MELPSTSMEYLNLRRTADGTVLKDAIANNKGKIPAFWTAAALVFAIWGPADVAEVFSEGNVLGALVLLTAGLFCIKMAISRHLRSGLMISYRIEKHEAANTLKELHELFPQLAEMGDIFDKNDTGGHYEQGVLLSQFDGAYQRLLARQRAEIQRRLGRLGNDLDLLSSDEDN